MLSIKLLRRFNCLRRKNRLSINTAIFLQFLSSFLFINKTLRISNLKSRTATNVKISVFVICAEVIIYLLDNLRNLRLTKLLPLYHT